MFAGDGNPLPAARRSPSRAASGFRPPLSHQRRGTPTRVTSILGHLVLEKRNGMLTNELRRIGPAGSDTYLVR